MCAVYHCIAAVSLKFYTHHSTPFYTAGRDAGVAWSKRRSHAAPVGRSRPPQAAQSTLGGPEEAQLRVLMPQKLLEPSACCEAPTGGARTSQRFRSSLSPDLRCRGSSVRQPNSSPPAKVSLAADVSLMPWAPVRSGAAAYLGALCRQERRTQ